MNNLKVLHFDKVEVSEATGGNKASASKEFGICHYWYILNKGFEFQMYAISVMIY